MRLSLKVEEEVISQGKQVNLDSEKARKWIIPWSLQKETVLLTPKL